MKIQAGLWWSLVLLAVLFMGCEGTKYGATAWCQLESTPEGAQAYLIPTLRWKGPEMLKDARSVERWHKGTTPVTSVRAANHPFVYVVLLGDQVAYREVYPQLGTLNHYTLDLP